MKRSEWLKKAEAALEEIGLFQERHTFKVHPLYRVGLCEKNAESFNHVFGKPTFNRWKKNLRNLRNREWMATPKFSVKLPPDSIVFLRDDKYGLIAASFKEKYAFKICFMEESFKPFDEEIKTLKRIQETEFAPYAPKVLREGMTSNGGRWFLTSFCSNLDNPRNEAQPEEFLLKKLPQTILPALSKFYQGFSPEILSVEEWLKDIEKKIELHPSKDSLYELVRYIQQRAGNIQLVRSNIHHDIHSGNILMSGDQLTIIDWEIEVRGLVLVDVFDFWRRYIMKKGLPIDGNVPLIQQSYAGYQEWMKKEFDVDVDYDFKLTSALYALERSLIYYEVRQINRMTDRKGMEFQILKAIRA